MILLALLLAASATDSGCASAPWSTPSALAKPDASFSLAPLSKRVWDFISEVLLQSKVVRERPLVGVAHAFVFWGFCAFSLVTLNHLAAGFGFAFLSRAGWFGRGYFLLAAVFAVCVAVSITGLFVRRFLVRPRWLGTILSLESGVIAIVDFAPDAYVSGNVLGSGKLPRSSSSVVVPYSGAC